MGTQRGRQGGTVFVPLGFFCWGFWAARWALPLSPPTTRPSVPCAITRWCLCAMR